MKRWLALLLLVLAQAVWADDTAEGVAAFDKRDYATALSKFSAGAIRGEAWSQNFLGAMYEEGKGVAKDYAEAARWYRLAAQQGNAIAQSNLGVKYEKGQGVAQDYKEAARWYRLAAQQGLAIAQSNLGAMYANGYGVLQDTAQAHMWLNIAAANGHSRSVKNRDIIAARMTPQQIGEAQRMARECMNSNYKKCD